MPSERRTVFVERDTYIETFFEMLKAQLREAKVKPDGKSATYRNLTVAASWSNELWEVQLNNAEVAEPIRRQYDPTKARSAEGAANYFVDELRRATGQEPLPRPEAALRHNGRRPQRV
jgi:hypothetical protein